MVLEREKGIFKKIKQNKFIDLAPAKVALHYF